MNIWTEKSLALANQRDYLDQLFRVYPMSANLLREISKTTIEQLENFFSTKRDNKAMITLLLQEEIFPVKDSYVAYLKRDNTAIERNPNTVNRLAGAIYSMGLDEVIKHMTQPKETNRQIGPLFKNWIRSGALGIEVTENTNYFLRSSNNLILDASDASMKEFAEKFLGYHHEKGLDFIGKMNGKYIIGEAKFLTDFGGHQNAQLADALATINVNLASTKYRVMKVAILDGVIYIPNRGKMYQQLSESDDNKVILSSLLLRDYLYSL
jgi:hypothetical protein